MKTFLMLIAVVLMAIGAPSAWAGHHEEMTAGEELVESTEAMSTEAEAEFNADVDCVDGAMGDEMAADGVEVTEGEVPAADCVSKEETPDDMSAEETME